MVFSLCAYVLLSFIFMLCFIETRLFVYILWISKERMNIHLLLFVSFPWWIFFSPPSTIIFVVDLEGGGAGEVGIPQQKQPTNICCFCCGAKIC